MNYNPDLQIPTVVSADASEPDYNMELSRPSSRDVWRILGKPIQTSSRQNPFDLTPCIDTSSGIWRDFFLEAELGVSDTELDITRHAQYAGLLNMGATCYVNSFVQSVYFNADFMAVVMSVGAAAGSALHAFQSLLGDLKYSILARVSPLGFLDKFSIKLNLQEDAAEFSTLLLNWLDQQVGGNRVRSLFEGVIEHSTTCSACGHVSVSRERFMELQVAADVGTLSGANFFRSEVIDGYRCGTPGCSPANPSAVRSSVPVSLPKHLRVVVNRYRYSVSAGREKISAPLTVPLLNFVAPSKDVGTTRYACVGILEHHSDRASSGHYTASLRDASDKWWLLDDGTVEPIWLTATGTSGKRKSVKSSWSETACVSSSAYVLLYEREGVGAISGSEEQAHLRAEAEQRNAVVTAELEVKRDLKQRLVGAVSERKRLVEALKLSDGQRVERPLFAVAANALQAWSNGQDLRLRFFPATVAAGAGAPLCEHGRVSPLSVRTGTVKFLPVNLSGISWEAEICSVCSAEVEAQVQLGLEYFTKLKQLMDAKFNVLVRGFENGDVGNTAVWVYKPAIPKVRKDYTAGSALLDKMSQADPNVVRPEFDLTASVACVHKCLLAAAATDSDFVLKPLELVRRLQTLSGETRDDWFSFAPKVSSTVVLDDQAAPGCHECDLVDSRKNSTLSSLKGRIAELFAKEPILDLAKLDPGAQYFVFPAVWAGKLKNWALNEGKPAPKDLRMDTLVCPHGDLKIDVVASLQEGNKDKLPFVIFPEWEGKLVLSEEFRTALGMTGGPVSPVLIERDRTYSVGSCPIPCTVCVDVEVPVNKRGVSIRVFHEHIDTLDSLSKPVKVNLNDTVILYKPGRSRLVGAAPGIEETTTGVDIKLGLIDIGILDQSPFPISADDAIGRLNVYVAHPSMRGSLVQVKDEIPIIETIASLAPGGRSSLSTFDTVYVEFTKASADSSPKRRRKGPVASDKDAGMQGSILRGH